jgi:putative DNA primase/helicase
VSQAGIRNQAEAANEAEATQASKALLACEATIMDELILRPDRSLPLPAGTAEKAPATSLENVPEGNPDAESPFRAGQCRITDSTNADLLVKAHGEDLLYCVEMRSWLVWDQCRWEVDHREHARNLMDKTMRKFVKETVDTGNEGEISSASRCLDTFRISNGLREAQHRLAINANKLDQHRFLLTFRNGTLNLETGVLGPHDRKHFITKMVHHNYNPQAKCPRWLAFLKRAVGQEGVAYLQKVMGYALTGDTSEKKFFVIGGPKNVGKTTFLETGQEILREHGALLRVDTLLDKKGGDSAKQEDLVALRGARFARTSELERDRRLSVTMLKRLVQGMGQITAAAKYERKITFDESHKLFIDTNHLPAIPADEDALWDRFVVIWFDNPLPEEQWNKKLKRQLVHDEAEGILAWAVAGELRRQREGLQDVPDQFAREKSKWQEEMDPIKRWIAEYCRTGERLRVERNVCYQSYKAARDGLYVMSLPKFTERVAALGFHRTKDRRYYQGLELLEPGPELRQSDVKKPNVDVNILYGLTPSK